MKQSIIINQSSCLARTSASRRNMVRILLIVEGINDIEFLRRISLMLSRHDHRLPNLAEMECQGELIFIPFGGGHVRAWTERLAPLEVPEFHLYDRELPPETDHRKEAASNVNRRPSCVARLTAKRSLENYLHPEAIFRAGSVQVDFDDFDSVSQIVARALYRHGPGQTAWQLQSQRARNRMTNRTKRWLNTVAAEQMTPALLEERDPAGEVVGWMKEIARLTAQPQTITEIKGDL